MNGFEYKWIVDEKEVRIYDYNKKLFRVEKSIISSITDYDGYYNNRIDYGSIRPKMIMIWIANNIKI